MTCRVTAIRPGSTLQWPTVTIEHGGATIAVATASKPLDTQIELRLFSQQLPQTGIPEGDPAVVKCRPPASSGRPEGNSFTIACAVKPSNNGLQWGYPEFPLTRPRLYSTLDGMCP